MTEQPDSVKCTYFDFPYADGASPAILRLDLKVTEFLSQQPEAGEQWYMARRLAYQAEAKRFVHVMLTHMPGGLVDAVFAELAAQKASLFIVPQLKE
jgi:hypothetical protein